MATRRYLFVDLFRGWAVITMIETHAVNAWMDVPLRETMWFSWLNVVNGFVAPSFLFIAGVSFAFVCHARWDDMVRPSWALWKQYRRLLLILGIGYWLHIPRFILDGWIPRVVEADLAEFWRADILHTIAVSMIILYFVAFFAKRKDIFLAVLGLMTGAALAATPAIWHVDFHETLHPAVANYLNGMHNPLFPLLPWCVFLWSGVFVSFSFLHAVEQQREQRAVNAITATGGIVFIAAWIADRLPVRIFEYENFWLTSPNWVLMRLGILLMLFGLFWLLEHRGWHTSERVQRIGSQSLFAYVVHLMIIYSITGEKAGFPFLRQDHSVPVTILLFTLLLVVVYLLSAGWAETKCRGWLRWIGIGR
jgi:uncharacterized membrane protein